MCVNVCEISVTTMTVRQTTKNDLHYWNELDYMHSIFKCVSSTANILMSECIGRWELAERSLLFLRCYSLLTWNQHIYSPTMGYFIIYQELSVGPRPRGQDQTTDQIWHKYFRAPNSPIKNHIYSMGKGHGWVSVTRWVQWMYKKECKTL